MDELWKKLAEAEGVAEPAQVERRARSSILGYIVPRVEGELPPSLFGHGAVQWGSSIAINAWVSFCVCGVLCRLHLGHAIRISSHCTVLYCTLTMRDSTMLRYDRGYGLSRSEETSIERIREAPRKTTDGHVLDLLP